jgi:hypothetical protein
MGGGAGGGAGGKKRRSKRTKTADSNAQRLNSGSGSGSGSDSEYDSKSDYEYESGKVVNNLTKVSDLLHGNNNIGSGDSKKSKRVLAIPAGIFLIKSATTVKQPSSSSSSASASTASSATSFSSTYDDSRIRAMFDDSNSVEDDENSDDSSAGASAGASVGTGMAKSAVISEDLYSKLFKMLAPNDADRKRYWVSAATTCRVRNGIGKCTQESHHGAVPAAVSSANKKTRKNRLAKIL